MLQEMAQNLVSRGAGYSELTQPYVSEMKFYARSALFA